MNSLSMRVPTPRFDPDTLVSTHLLSSLASLKHWRMGSTRGQMETQPSQRIPNGSTVVTVHGQLSKDHSVILWDMQQSKRIVNLWDHWKKRGDEDMRTEGQALSVACSDDGRYAAVGRNDASLQIFDIRQSTGNNLVKTFTGHKSAITCLAFQTQSLQLFSGSEDRCVR